MDFANEKQFEDALVELLVDKGWKDGIFNYPTEAQLMDNWAKILYDNNRDIDKLDNYPLTQGEMNQILDQIGMLKTPYKLNSFINGKYVTIKRDNPDDVRHLHNEVSLRIYDRDQVANGKSIYQIARQPRFLPNESSVTNRRGDVTLLINGMPVIHVELKAGNVSINKACNQIKKYSHEHKFTGLFSLIQIFVAMTPGDALYFTNPGTDGIFDEKNRYRWTDVDNIAIKDWEEFTKRFLYIPMAHQLIGFYTVPDERDGTLKVLRPYQYYAVIAIEDVVSKNKDKWDEGSQRGGYIWHTTGSGKTLTSFKAADLISKSGDADKVVFLVDRRELDTQSLKRYKNFADDSDDVQGTGNTGILVSKLKSSNPADVLIVTTIQKLYRIKEGGSIASEREIEEINKKHIVFIVDECHRDTFGEMMGAIKETFPHALFFGFTGTPIFEDNEKNDNMTKDVFGDELHRYTIVDGIRDKNVLGFDCNLVETFDMRELKRKVILHILKARTIDDVFADPKKRDKFIKLWHSMPMERRETNGGKVKGVEDYVKSAQYNQSKHHKAVVKHILENYEIVSNTRMLHSIFATSSIDEAIEYYRLFKAADPTLRTTVLVDSSDNNEDRCIERLDELDEVIDDYNKRYGTLYTRLTYKDMKKNVADRMSHDEPFRGIENYAPEMQLDMLIVVDQMLTGFDSKWVNALYLDKVLKNENVIQAFSRTNRPFGQEKPIGSIYWFRYPYSMKLYVKNAVKLYSGDRPRDVFVDKLETNLVTFNSIYEQIKNLFETQGIENFSRLPDDESARAKFAQLFSSLYATYKKVRVQGFSWGKKIYGNRQKRVEVAISKQAYFTLLQRYKELAQDTGIRTRDDVPYDLNTSITENEVDRIDEDYLNSNFKRWYRQLQEERSLIPSQETEERLSEIRKRTSDAMGELTRNLSALPADQQEAANAVIRMLQLDPSEILDENKSFQDYISEYISRKKNDQICKFAATFGIGEEKLRYVMRLHLTETEVTSHVDELQREADHDKVTSYMNAHFGESLSDFRINIKFTDLLRDFISRGGFDIANEP